MRLDLVALALASALAAGCTSPQEGGTHVTGIVADEAVDPVLRTVSKEMTLAQGATLGGADFPQHAWINVGASSGLDLEVAPQAGVLVIELERHAGHGRVLLHAIPPSAADRTPLLVDSRTLYAEQDEAGRARLVVEDPEPGKWGFDVHADGAVVGFEGTLHATSLLAAMAGFSAVA